MKKPVVLFCLLTLAQPGWADPLVIEGRTLSQPVDKKVQRQDPLQGSIERKIQRIDRPNSATPASGAATPTSILKGDLDSTSFTATTPKLDPPTDDEMFKLNA